MKYAATCNTKYAGISKNMQMRNKQFMCILSPNICTPHFADVSTVTRVTKSPGPSQVTSLAGSTLKKKLEKVEVFQI